MTRWYRVQAHMSAAMGQLFARSRQRGPIAARYADELKRRIGGATGVDAHLDDGRSVRRYRVTNAQRRRARSPARPCPRACRRTA